MYLLNMYQVVLTNFEAPNFLHFPFFYLLASLGNQSFGNHSIVRASDKNSDADRRGNESRTAKHVGLNNCFSYKRLSHLSFVNLKSFGDRRW